MAYPDNVNPDSYGSLTFKVIYEDNDTLIGQFIKPNISDQNRSYDAPGALCYILAIVFMYSFSILMIMVGSFLRKTPKDNTIVRYVKDTKRLGKLKLKQEKFRTKLQMHQKRVHRILGPDRAEVLDGTEIQTPPSDGVFDWDSPCTEWDVRRHSESSATTTIVCADDLRSADLPFFFQPPCQVFEKNGYLSAPNSPTVHQKSILGHSGDEDCTIGDISLAPPIVQSISRSSSAGCLNIPKITFTATDLSIPEVRIIKCD